MREKRWFADGREQNPGGAEKNSEGLGRRQGPPHAPGPADEVGNEFRGQPHDSASSGAVDSGTTEPPQGWSRGGQRRGGAWVTTRPLTLHTHPERGWLACA